MGVLAFRFIAIEQSHFMNIAPVAALAVCLGMFIPRVWISVAVAMGFLILSDLFVNAYVAVNHSEIGFFELIFSWTVLCRYIVYGLILAVALGLRSRGSAGLALVTTLGASLFFYVVMNTIAWASSPAPLAYAKTLGGWWQAQTVGLPIPGAPPSWFFLRNAMIGDLVFTTLFLTATLWLPAWMQRRALGDSRLNPSEDAV